VAQRTGDEIGILDVCLLRGGGSAGLAAIIALCPVLCPCPVSCVRILHSPQEKLKIDAMKFVVPKAFSFGIGAKYGRLIKSSNAPRTMTKYARAMVAASW